ncbi:MAG: apolipoprotein N-acyltransferase, partial [Saprospiraceae bacterium]|nr:apolipoprotein N-acyltransferase [Saprospiraceae bacterium]
PFVLSLITYITYNESGETIEVVAVQPNFEPHYEKFNFPAEDMTKRMVTLAGEKVTPNTKFVVLPETSISLVNLDKPWESASMQKLAAFARDHDVDVVTGLAAYRYLDKPEDTELPTTIPIDRSGVTYFLEQYNCAVDIDPDQGIQEYYKALYVPGAEFFPYKRLLFFLQPIVDALGGTNYGYRIRTKFALFESSGTLVAPPICYESIFGEFVTRFVQKGAEVIFVMTNDGWWDNTAGYRQHAAFARLRAIETRRDVIRAANMGTCCLINQRGDLSDETTYGQEAAINVEAHKNQKITFYVRWGDFLGRISLFLALILISRASLKKFKA